MVAWSKGRGPPVLMTQGAPGENPGPGNRSRQVMQTVTAETAPKPRARKASKPAQRQASPKTKATFYLSADAVKRLGLHAVMLGTDRSALVEQLILDSLRRFRVSDWGGPMAPLAEVDDRPREVA
jgi:hypothetical protein